MRDIDGLRLLLEQQDQVIARSQLAELGVDRHLVRTQIRAGRWRTAGPHAVLAVTGTPTTRQREWIAVLHNGPRSQLAGLTAAAARGLRGWPSRAIHVLVPYDAQMSSLPGVLVHRTRQWTQYGGRPARCPIAESLVQAASWAQTDSAAVGVLAAGVQQRLLTGSELRRAATKAHGRRALIRNTCADLEGGAEALSEIRFGRIAKRAGLPPPKRQAVRTDAAGRRRYLDADFGGFAVEVDGMAHLDPQRHADDLRRQNDLVLAGERILRFSALTVRTESTTVVRQLTLAARLWR